MHKMDLCKRSYCQGPQLQACMEAPFAVLQMEGQDS